MNRITPTITTALLVLATSTASADEAGAKALAAIDAVLHGATAKLDYEATNQEKGKAETRIGLQVHAKGVNRLVAFVAPADLKGTKVLILGPTQMYVYLPAFGKVRRIASHTSDQSAFGMAFTSSDLAPQTFASQYTATVVATTDAELKLALTPKEGTRTLELIVERSKNVPSEIRYYSADRKHVRTETRTGYTCVKTRCTAGTVKMVDHVKNLTTTLVLKSWKLDEAISDDVFSKRNLER